MDQKYLHCNTAYLYVALLCFMFLVLSSAGQLCAQARLGYTEAQIRKMDSDFNYERGTTDDGVKFISTVSGSGLLAHYFNSAGISTKTVLIPLTEGLLHGAIENFNSRYVIIDKKTWNIYTDTGDVIEVKLRKGNNDVLYFEFTPAE